MGLHRPVEFAQLTRHVVRSQKLEAGGKRRTNMRAEAMRRASAMVQWRLAAGMGLGLLVAVVAGLEAQGQVPAPGGQAAAIKSEVRIVLVDVVVTDGNRRPVTG